MHEQSETCTFAVPSVFESAGQSVHSVSPSAAYLPSAQAMQAVLSELTMKPATQVHWLMSVEAVPSVVESAGHTWHSWWPVWSAYVLCGHGSQLSLLLWMTPEYPELQRHSVAPSSAAVELAGQSVHELIASVKLVCHLNLPASQPMQLSVSSDIGMGTRSPKMSDP